MTDGSRKKHTLGRRLALGTVQFGLAYGVANKDGAVSPNEACSILDEAVAIGIDTLDTAVGYGESEAVLGRLDAGRFRVVSKLPGLPADVVNVEQWVRSQLAGSRQRLRMARLDGMLLHRPSDLLGPQGQTLYTSLLRLREDGLVGKIGVSVYGPAELEALFADYDFDLVQAPLNIIDTRLVDSGWSDRLATRGIELHTRSVFLQGLLLMSPSERPKRFARFSHIWKCWDGWLQENELSPLQACLRYANSQQGVSKIVIGVDSCLQLQDIAIATTGVLATLPAWPDIDPILINPSTWSSL